MNSQNDEFPPAMFDQLGDAQAGERGIVSSLPDHGGNHSRTPRLNGPAQTMIPDTFSVPGFDARRGHGRTSGRQGCGR
jgi:hypothetical protein